MLSERKRFNYMANSGHYNSAQKKNYNNPRPTTSSLFHDQPNSQLPAPQQDKENQQAVKDTLKKTEELELINKKLVEETAKQFKKLEQDVQRVEAILSEKEQAAEEHKRENEKLREEVSTAGDEKKILIEAIFEKDIVIKEYENKLTEMLQENAKQAEVPAKEELAEMTQTSMQTEAVAESCPKSELMLVQSQNCELEDETFRLKEQLFDATNKVKLLTQEFEAYKILKEIECIQDS